MKNLFVNDQLRHIFLFFFNSYRIGRLAMNTGAVVGAAVGGGVIVLVVITLLLILILVVKVLFIRRGTLLRLGTQNSLRASSAS